MGFGPPGAFGAAAAGATVAAAAAVVRALVAGRLDGGIIAGSGLEPLAARLSADRVIAYEQIPGWPRSTVPGHSGRLAVGRMGGLDVAVALGRAHLYEGYSPQAVVFGVRVLVELGARFLIVTNAAGSLSPRIDPGQLVVLSDHLFLPGLAGAHPLAGPNDDAVGPRFPTLRAAYDPVLRRLALASAARHGLPACEGVYAMVAGPSFETPAEARMLAALGADVVGMSSVPEVVTARHAGLRVLGLSVVTNRVGLAPADEATGDVAEGHAAVLAAAAAAAAPLAAVVEDVVAGLAREG